MSWSSAVQFLWFRSDFFFVHIEFSLILSLPSELHQSLLPLSSDVNIYQLVNEQLQTSDAHSPV